MATTFRFYIHPDASAELENHYVPYYGENGIFYYVKLLEAIPSASYDHQQWESFAPGQESYPTNFLCRSIGTNIWKKSAFITQGTDLEDVLAAEDCDRFAAGTWRILMYFVSAGAVPDTTYNITFYVYLRSGSSENLLFQWTTETFGPSFIGPEIFDSPEQVAHDVSAGDQLVVKAYIQRVNENLDAVRTLMGKTGDTEYYAYIEFPGDATPGPMYLAKGWIVGNVELRDNSFQAELRGRAQHLQQNMLELYTPGCRASLGDTRCGIDLEDSAGTYRHSGAVSSVTDDRLVFIDDSVPGSITEDVFGFGLLTWSEPESGDGWTGNNAGFQIEIKKYEPGTKEFTLFQPMPYAIGVGDEFEVTWGCDKSLETCRDRYGM
jgi:hypothetical protein